MPSMKLRSVRLSLRVFPIALSLVGPMAYCQTGTPNTTVPDQALQQSPKTSDLLHPALSQVSQTIVALNISRWKAPSEVRSATQQNVDSIQRDLNGTLPALLASADAAPESVSAVFPVYRNIDALYDVLLRVSQTAMLAAPTNEAASVNDALGKLESARNDLSAVILTASKNNEAQVLKLKASIQQAAAVQAAAPPKTTVVNDGPAAPPTPKRKKKPAPAASSTQTPPPQQ